MNGIRDHIEGTIKWKGLIFDNLTYESKVNLALRFMIDKDIVIILVNTSFR